MVFAQHLRSDRDGGGTPVHVAAAVGSFPRRQSRVVSLAEQQTPRVPSFSVRDSVRETKMGSLWIVIGVQRGDLGFLDNCENEVENDWVCGCWNEIVLYSVFSRRKNFSQQLYVEIIL